MAESNNAKTLVFKNKRVKDAIKSRTIDGHKAKRDIFKEIPDNMKSNDAQIKCINTIYLDVGTEISKDQQQAITLMRREIRSKIDGYGRQDKNKGLFDKESLINLDECVGKLVACKLRCHYCKKGTTIFYEDVRQSNQWTLERIDNDLPHTSENTVISCLQCNLSRRCQNMDKFHASKEMKICKQE